MRPWLREVARKLAMNEMRRKRPVALSPHDIEGVVRENGDAGGVAGAAFGEEVAALRACLNGLPAADRAVLAARYEKNRPLAAIAAEVEQTVGYIKQRFFRLRKRLAECIKRRLGLKGGGNV